LKKIAPAYKGIVLYTSKAMDGLTLGNRIVDPVQLPGLIEEWEKKRAVAEAGRDLPGEKAVAGRRKPVGKAKPKAVIAKPRAEPELMPSRWIETDVPEPPDLELHILRDLPTEEIFKYVNVNMLYGKHLWVENLTKRLKDQNDEKLLKLQGQVREVFEEAVWEDIIVPQAIHRWFRAWPEGEQICVENPDGGEPEKFYFPRQRNSEELSAVDWIRPRELGGDYVNMFVCTTGPDVGYKSTQMRKEGRLLASHILQALALEMTEATAEWLHEKLRRDWGFADPPSFMLEDLFKARYRGIRLSFGYPACPVIEDQKGLFRLLKPEQIGVELTEGMMMDPEASLSAMLFHHPQARYFGSGF
ncbi:MAG TPA: methionine synthase, partial [Bacteroidetes bacterium]|nr:methionine synthase [Bacteroidota bacterium]